MKRLRDLLHTILNEVADRGYKYRVALKVFMAMVVFVTTYMLILPAITLEIDKAAQQGGIDVPSVEQTEEVASETAADEKTADPDAENSLRNETSESENDKDIDKNNNYNIDNDTEPSKGEPKEEPEPEVTSAESEDVPEAANRSDAAAEENAVPEAFPLMYEGEGYTVSVSDKQNVLPEDTELSVNEITSEDKKYDKYCSDALTALKDNAGINSGSELNFVRLYDIKLISGGQTIEPQDSVEVTITYDSKDSSNTGDNALKIENEDNVYVVHFAEDEKTGEEQAEVLDKESTSFQVRKKQLEEAEFEADSFSVYAIVEAPDPVDINPEIVHNTNELPAIAADATGLYMSVNRSGNKDEYFNNTINENSAFTLEGNIEDGAIWYLESDGSGKYYIYTYVDGNKKYVNNPSGNLAGLVDSGGSKFEISRAADGKFYFKISGQEKWLQYSGSGSGIRYWKDKNNANNSRLSLTYADSIVIPDDPYDLDGKKYGIAYHNDNTSAAALTADSKTAGGQSRLAAEKLIIRPDILDHDGIFLVDEGKDMIEWSFESVRGDKYYLTTVVDGQKKYLTINNNNVTLENSPSDEYSVISVIPGTGDKKGKYSFSVHNYYLNLQNGNVNDGFNGILSPQNTSWLNLVEKTSLEDDDFSYYTARKVSVSDTEKVKDGSQVVLYTRIWNDNTMRYDFFVVDHDGTLLPCNDSGDAIEWIGSGVNTSLWELTEYTNPDGTSTYYYELRNTQYGDYIAPQVSVGDRGQVFSPDTIGINLNGRKNGENSTTIIAWDKDQYAYSGLKTQDGHIVPCTLSEAEDFYFAIIDEPEPGEPLTEVPTIDNDRYGITMKMIDFNNKPLDRDRDPKQTAFFGRDTDKAGMLSTDLDENGYPVGTSEIPGDGRSLSELFDNMSDVNHLFIESTYNESGYFEYDSTQNFAHLNNTGDFTVYDQLGAIDGPNYGTMPTRTHGQFMPYNDIDPDDVISAFSNWTDVNANELDDTDPRKGEDLHRIKLSDADYFFGMEMEASFTQTADGLDAWGHDIIFEFSGDDDFWFYVDGELVLDLGGVHRAMSGSINFRTGEVRTSGRGNSTLYEIFRDNYRARGMSEAEIAQKLAEIFKQNDDGQYVFKDYTNHDMKMFYMERGAGASNLHMRFNLSAVEPGAFLLSKKLSGTDNPNNDLIEFPYQIYYTTKVDGVVETHLLGENPGDQDRVTYKDTTTKVKYKGSYTPAGGTVPYDSVFFLKPGQTAQVKLPEGAISYYAVECGVNPDVYDSVSVNDVPVNGIPTENYVGDTARCDYRTIEDTLKERTHVDFDNHVKEGAMRTLAFTKKLYGADGETILHYPEDTTPFDFRLFLGNESADPQDLPPANLYKYYVKDGDGNYCRRNSQTKTFDSLGIKTYPELLAYLANASAPERDAVIFVTSPSGAISQIPADHTVEVRDLIVDTQYKILERADEIPKGYTLRITDGYTRTDGSQEQPMGDDPVSGDINVDEDPAYEVRNQIGWGLTVKKVWTDKDFMKDHDYIFFAVYVRTGEGPHDLELVEDSVRALKKTEDEVYYFFESLDVGGRRYTFKDFVIREVDIGPHYTVDEETGEVSGYNHVHPYDDGDQMHIGGTAIDGQRIENIHYIVTYQPGESTGHNENVRIDTVTNSRPGIKIYKTEWDFEIPLGGAKFTLKDAATGHDVAVETYTSRDSDGLVTVATVDPGNYILTEIETPKGFVAFDPPIVITLEQNGHISTNDGGEFSLITHQPHGAHDMSELKVRNRTVELKAIKLDSSTQQEIEGAHFALYRQVTDTHGVKRKDYNPMSGYEDLITGADGIIPQVDMLNLNPGTYYLDETIPAAGYEDIEDICFTIGADGTVTIDSGTHGSISEKIVESGSRKLYTLSVLNGKMKKVSFMKVDIAATDTPLAEAEFDLYDVIDGERSETARITGLVSDTDGMLAKDGRKVFELPEGTYQLIETKAPPGYILREDPVDVIINSAADSASVAFNDTTTINGVTYDDKTTLSSNGKGIAYNNDSKVYTMKISNTAGVELPSCGGIGTTLFYVLGSLIFLISAAALMVRLRRI